MNESVLNSKLKKSVLYQELEKRCNQDPELASVITLVQNVGNYSLNISKTIIVNMPEFTLHDQEHIFNMLYIAGKLIPKKTLEKLSNPDLLMIILAIFLHDIGMSPEASEIKAWKGQDNDSLSQKFIRFRKARVQKINEIDELKKRGESVKVQLIEDQIIMAYIRDTHAKRARRMIASDWAGKIKYLDTDLTAELADLCFSHNEDRMALLKMETVKLCAEDTYLCLPFVAIILRLADIIDFDPKRTPEVLFSHLTIKDPISLAEWRKHQAINAWTINPGNLLFSAQCEHPAIESAILKFCDLIDCELRDCTWVLANLHSDICDMSLYKISLPQSVNRNKIMAKKDAATGKPIYIYHETKFTLNKRQVVDLLMGTKLYGNTDVALRELIQNSIDACLLRKSLSEKWGVPYIPKICVSFYNESGVDYLKVTDNGIGMNQHIIDNYYTNVGQSYYTSNEFYDLVSDANNSFKPISRFGIGILACFMVCDNMEVNTRRVIGQYQSDLPIKLVVEGYDSLFVITESNMQEPGTDTVLKLRKTHPWESLKANDFVKCVHKILPLPPFDIEIHSNDIKETYSQTSFENINIMLDKDCHWHKEDNIQIIDIDLNDTDKGFRGKALVAYISKKDGTVVDHIDISQKEVLIDYETYSLSSSILYGENCINKRTTSIEVDEDGTIESSNNTHRVNESKSFLSIHGIDVPCNLFSDYTNYGQKTVLTLPFPVVFRLDVGSVNDLNLNSARTQIIYDDKWLSFERNLVETICIKLKGKIGKNKWEELKAVFVSNVKKQELKELISKI
jgi:Molecular chaperone, HSP90 family